MGKNAVLEVETPQYLPVQEFDKKHPKPTHDVMAIRARVRHDIIYGYEGPVGVVMKREFCSTCGEYSDEYIF